MEIILIALVLTDCVLTWYALDRYNVTERGIIAKALFSFGPWGRVGFLVVRALLVILAIGWGIVAMGITIVVTGSAVLHNVLVLSKIGG